MQFFSRRPTVRTYRLGFTNDRKIPAVFVVEPWAYDYTAGPGQRVELVVRSASTDLWFNLVNDDDGTLLVYVEGSIPAGIDWDVLMDGTKVEIGHGRATWLPESRPVA